MKIENKKLGFTLSETLVAIAVIGVLAVVVLPLLQRTLPNQNKILFQKAYDILCSVIDDMLNNTSNMAFLPSYPTSATGTDSNGMTIVRGFNYTNPHYNIRSGYSSGSAYYNKFCYFFFTTLNTTADISTSCADADVPTDDAKLRTTSSDGITWYFHPPYADNTAVDTFSANTAWPLSPTAYTTKFVIDVNGLNNGPNCSADSGFNTYMPSSTYHNATPAYSSCTNTGGDAATNPCKFNPDTFIVGIRYDGKLQVGSGSATDACATFILNNPTDND